MRAVQKASMNISRKLPSRFDVIPDFILFVIKALKKEYAVNEQALFDIKLALEESLTNAIKHGNKLKPGLPVDVSVNTRTNQLIITVKDQGKGFNFKNVPDPTEKDRLTRTSGRGVFLIKKIMDEVRFYNGGRSIRMVKRLNGTKRG